MWRHCRDSDLTFMEASISFSRRSSGGRDGLMLRQRAGDDRRQRHDYTPDATQPTARRPDRHLPWERLGGAERERRPTVERLHDFRRAGGLRADGASPGHTDPSRVSSSAGTTASEVGAPPGASAGGAAVGGAGGGDWAGGGGDWVGGAGGGDWAGGGGDWVRGDLCGGPGMGEVG